MAEFIPVPEKGHVFVRKITSALHRVLPRLFDNQRVTPRQQLETIANDQKSSAREIPPTEPVSSTGESSGTKNLATERNIKPVTGDEWFPVDGVAYLGFGSESQYGTPADPKIHGERMVNAGTYETNGDMIAFVNESGEMFVGYRTEANYQRLHDAGYSIGTFWVPFSNGEIPVDPVLRQKFMDMKKNGERDMKLENRARHLEISRRRGYELGIKPLSGGIFQSIDGVEFHGLGYDGKITEISDGYELSAERFRLIGKYYTHSGVLALVDGSGVMHIGATITENYDALRSAGYTEEFFRVPFSNGETPTDEATRILLRDLLTGKSNAVLRAEREQRALEVESLQRLLFGSSAVMSDHEELISKIADKREIPLRTVEDAAQTAEKMTETDNGGFHRTVYTVNGAVFTFKGREELPLVPSFSKKSVTVLGERANWIPDDQYEKYVDSLSHKDNPEGAAFVVNKSLTGVLELAKVLGANDPGIDRMIAEIGRGIYSVRALAIIDGLVAGNYFDSIGMKTKITGKSDAEMVMAMALTGDAQAQEAVQWSITQLQYFDKARETRFRINDGGIEGKGLNPAELCVVHATRFRPESDEHGNLLVVSTFDATKGKVFRSTVHTALNHKVEGHEMGSWGDAGYVLISPMEDMLVTNGLPAVLNTVDTYWDSNPGGKVVFANASLVTPGGAQITHLTREEGRTVMFKSEGYTIEDFLEYLDRFEKRTGEYSSADQKFLDAISSSYQEAWKGVCQPDSVKDQISIFVEGRTNYINGIDLIRKIAGTNGQAPQQDISAAIRAFSEASGLRNLLEVPEAERDGYMQAFADRASEKINSLMFELLNDSVTKDVIAKRGFRVEAGGKWAWANSFDVTARTKELGARMGVRVGAHANMAEGALEDQFRWAISVAKGILTNETHEFEWKTYAPSTESIAEQLKVIGPKERRVLYASGLLTARE